MLRRNRGEGFCAIVACVLVAALGGEVLAAALTSDAQVDRSVEVRNVAVSGDTVSGVVANRSSLELREIQLLITDAFVWKDDLHPGSVSPGSSFYFTVPSPVPPGDAIPFSTTLHRPYVDPDLGTFHTTVQPIGFTEVERPRTP